MGFYIGIKIFFINVIYIRMYVCVCLVCGCLRLHGVNLDMDVQLCMYILCVYIQYFNDVIKAIANCDGMCCRSASRTPA